MTGPERSRRPSTALLQRPVLFVVAWIFLGLGIVGLFLPLLPGTVFMILSAACFTRSSPRFETWLLNHPRLGPPVLRWRETGAIPRYAKIFAITSLTVSWGIILLTDAPGFVKIGCLILFCAVALYITIRPER